MITVWVDNSYDYVLGATLWLKIYDW